MFRIGASETRLSTEGAPEAPVVHEPLLGGACTSIERDCSWSAVTVDEKAVLREE